MSAEILGQLAQSRHNVRSGTDGSVASNDVHRRQRAAGAAPGDQRAPAQQRLALGPPVSATTIRVRAAQVSWMP